MEVLKIAFGVQWNNIHNHFGKIDFPVYRQHEISRSDKRI